MLVVLALVGALAAEAAPANYDALLAGPKRTFTAPSSAKAAARGTVVRTHPQLGVPLFLFASPDGSKPQSSLARWAQDPRSVSRGFLADFAPLYGLSPVDVEQAELAGLHDTGFGPIIASYRQRIGGVELFHERLNVVLNAKHELVGFTGYLSPHASALAAKTRNATNTDATLGFRLSESEALASALGDKMGTELDGNLFRVAGTREHGYQHYALVATPRTLGGQALVGTPRVKRVLYQLADGLEAAYYTELETSSPASRSTDEFAYVVSAQDGRVLFRENLVAYDAYKYRAYADTTGSFRPWDAPFGTAASPSPSGTPVAYQAPLVAANLVTLQNSPFSKNDPWLPAGATATVGNNVDAYVDLSAADGLSAGDFRAPTSAAGTFDYTYDTAVAPAANVTNQNAGITQLFYNTNFFHDWYYDVGFDEASGNAQTSNFGRGGAEGDSLKAEAQDYSGLNNANMSTPADGSRPRMQMYVFNGVAASSLTVNAPLSLAGVLAVGTAAFGLQSFNLPGDVYLPPAPFTACAPLAASDVAGKIVLIDRGSCSFDVKTHNAQLGNAAGVIIANNAAGVIKMGASDPSLVITIPVLSISQADGVSLRTTPSGTALNVTLAKSTSIDRDGTLDNSVVAHEWGHFISNRLIGDASGLGTQYAGGMGEGWGDFHALLLTVRAEDINVPSNANWSGAYPVGAYDTGGPGTSSHYFGIRRVPYSTDFAKNAFTFKHTVNGTALPTGVPTAFGQDGANNLEVHNIGEVWATMLWECYASLLRDSRYTFQQAQDRMKGYLVAGYKLTPVDPTFLDARDALLAAAYATDAKDWDDLAHAFAKRGLGTGAVAPSDTGVGLVESFVVGADLALVGATLDDEGFYCDHDGILDPGETGHLTVTIKNVGGVPLTQAQVAVTADNANVVIVGGGTKTFSSVGGYSQGTVTFDVTLKPTAILETATFSFTVTDAELNQPRNFTGALTATLNADIVNDSKTESFETSKLVWSQFNSVSAIPSALWALQGGAANKHLHANDVGATSDQSLVSPALELTGDLQFTFDHQFSFESDLSNNYDGAHVEASADDGGTWTDLGPSLQTGYKGLIATYLGDGNPLQNTNGYVNTSVGYPAFATEHVSSSAFHAQAVKIRFRLGSDNSGGAPGWNIDNVAFTGISNTPFPSYVVDRAMCVNRPPVVTMPATTSAHEGSAVNLAATATDADHDTLTYAWTQLSGPSATLTATNTNTLQFTAPGNQGAAGVLTFKLSVSDGHVSTDGQVEVDVSAASAPSAKISGATTAKAGDIVSLSGSGSTEPDGGALTFAWKQTAGGTSSSSGATTVSYKVTIPKDAKAGATFTYQLTAKGPTGLTGTAKVTVTASAGTGGTAAGCGCSTGSTGASAAAFPLLLLLALAMRRRSQG